MSEPLTDAEIAELQEGTAALQKRGFCGHALNAGGKWFYCLHMPHENYQPDAHAESDVLRMPVRWKREFAEIRRSI